MQLGTDEIYPPSSEMKKWTPIPTLSDYNKKHKIKTMGFGFGFSIIVFENILLLASGRYPNGSCLEKISDFRGLKKKNLREKLFMDSMAEHAFASTSLENGDVYGWGFNDYGQC